MVTLLPFFIGLAAVLQGWFNRRIMSDVSLALAVFLNACVFLGAAILYWLLIAPRTLAENANPNALKLSGLVSAFQPWYIAPGLFGFALVIGIPYSLSKIGAGPTFIILVASQILFSTLLDYWIAPENITPQKLIGAALCIAGAIVTTWKRTST